MQKPVIYCEGFQERGMEKEKETAVLSDMLKICVTQKNFVTNMGYNCQAFRTQTLSMVSLLAKAHSKYFKV